MWRKIVTWTLCMGVVVGVAYGVASVKLADQNGPGPLGTTVVAMANESGSLAV